MNRRRILEPARHDESLRALLLGLELSGLDDGTLWSNYLALGGTRGPDGLSALLRGEHPMSALEHDMIAQVLNETFLDQGADHPVPYADELPRS